MSACPECGCEHGHHQPWCGITIKHTLWQPPLPQGYYVIGGNLHIHVGKRPNWFNRFFMAYLLGWKWHDADGDLDE